MCIGADNEVVSTNMEICHLVAERIRLGGAFLKKVSSEVIYG